MLRCFVLGRIFGVRAISSAPELSSNTLQWMRGTEAIMENPATFNSTINLINGMTSRKAWDNEIYSLSVVLNAISVCYLEAHVMGQPPYVIT